jgi:hypothetical protein
MSAYTDITANLAELIAADPNVSPAFKAALKHPIYERGSARWLEVRAECQADEDREPPDEGDAFAAWESIR